MPLRLQPADEIEQRAARRRAPGCSSARRARGRGSRWRARARSRRAAAPPARVADGRVGRDIVRGRARRSAATAVARIRVALRRCRRRDRLDAEHDVFHHAQVRRERQLLIDHRDAGAPRVDRIPRRVRRAVQPHRRRRPARSRRQESPSACSCRRRSDRRARRPRRRGRRNRRRRARRWRRTPCATPRISKRGALSGFSHRDRSGCSSSLASGSFMRSRVTRRTPVSTRFSTGWPWMCATIVLTPR